jgi:RNA polymerase sigma-70 factor (ECF subfamily)
MGLPNRTLGRCVEVGPGRGKGCHVAALPLTEPAATSDAELVERLCKGDEVAFEQLYERYFKRIYCFVDRRLRNPADTEETVQEVFFNVFSSIGSFRGDAPFAAWVFGLTRRTIAGRFKKKRHVTVSLSDEDRDRLTPCAAEATDAPSPLEMCEFQEFVDRIDAAVNTRLNEEQRRLFQLHHVEDRPITEIARRFCKSENAIKSNLYRTRRILLAR